MEYAIAIDISGGMFNHMPKIKDHVMKTISELKAKGFDKLHISYFDTQIRSYAVYDQSNIDMFAIPEFDFGGGTLFEKPWDLLKEKSIKPDLLTIYTDGFPGMTWGDRDYCPTLFVISKTEGVPTSFAPFGSTIVI